ncbi:MAG: hypothetical protein CMJ80_11800 [Planctomycetaceae bacterium]|nr:hypothetical protein [Planctomycetaceae bacterium]
MLVAIRLRTRQIVDRATNVAPLFEFVEVLPWNWIDQRTSQKARTIVLISQTEARAAAWTGRPRSP